MSPTANKIKKISCQFGSDFVKKYRVLTFQYDVSKFCSFETQENSSASFSSNHGIILLISLLIEQVVTRDPKLITGKQRMRKLANQKIIT